MVYIIDSKYRPGESYTDGVNMKLQIKTFLDRPFRYDFSSNSPLGFDYHPVIAPPSRIGQTNFFNILDCVVFTGLNMNMWRQQQQNIIIVLGSSPLNLTGDGLNL